MSKINIPFIGIKKEILPRIIRIWESILDLLKKILLYYSIFVITLIIMLYFNKMDNITVYNLSLSVLLSGFLSSIYSIYSNHRKKDLFFIFTILILLVIAVFYGISTYEIFKNSNITLSENINNNIGMYKYILYASGIFYLIVEFVISYNESYIKRKYNRSVNKVEPKTTISEKKEKLKEETNYIASGT